MIDYEKKLEEEIDREIKKQEHNREILCLYNVGLWQQAFPQAYFNWYWGSELEMTLPFDFELIRQVQEFVSDHFPNWKLCRDNQFIWEEQDSAGRFLEYHVKDAAGHLEYFQVSFRTGREGTTCVLKKIGEQNKIVPIYEITCGEGALEKVGG